jgi:glycosyltransferase involved in cell wall biosynthesis
VHFNADQSGALPDLIGPDSYAGRYTIGYWAWELAEFPDALVPAFDAVHEVWVPSTFVAMALQAKTSKPVWVMGHSIKPDRVPPDRATLGLPDDAVVFLAAVDFNSFLERKNVLGAIAAFRSAFGVGDENVHLVIKAHGGTGAFREARARLTAALGQDRRITLIDEVLTRREIDVLYASIDVFVSLHRAEGFGLPIAECMRLGKVVIATDYSGSRDFVSADCALPVPYRLVPVDDSIYPLGDGQNWAEPDLVDAARLMRLVVADPALRSRLGQAAKEQIERDYSPEAVGARMAARLDAIRAGLAEE